MVRFGIFTGIVFLDVMLFSYCQAMLRQICQKITVKTLTLHLDLCLSKNVTLCNNSHSQK